MAEDYSPFDVDVTTEEPAADALTRSSSSDDTFGNRVMITPTNFYPNAGGVSYVGAFDDVGDYYKTSWVFSNMLANGEKYIAEACSHENGHSVGLHHEGTTSGTAYYQGQGDWAPIMGNSYYKNVTQWAKGEYTGANNTEDQLQVMQNYGLAYFADDHGNTADTATQLAVGTTISESGFIERNTDVDVFKLLAGAGALSISVSPAPLGPDLKILAELRDSGGNVLGLFEPFQFGSQHKRYSSRRDVLSDNLGRWLRRSGIDRIFQLCQPWAVRNYGDGCRSRFNEAVSDRQNFGDTDFRRGAAERYFFGHRFNR